MPIYYTLHALPSPTHHYTPRHRPIPFAQTVFPPDPRPKQNGAVSSAENNDAVSTELSADQIDTERSDSTGSDCFRPTAGITVDENKSQPSPADLDADEASSIGTAPGREMEGSGDASVSDGGDIECDLFRGFEQD
ncbi:hypothetical protein RUND412_007823 [Rhizina undulata]